MREIFTSGSVKGLIATLGAITSKKKGVLWALLDKMMLDCMYMVTTVSAT
ncbi:MAG: hypothetical protein AEth_00901 [Candidatus Argoarchaeum ethanivorans]|uniref:Uncharacterized protein n=1 Tax=Candidatus Argoarchaeum ethanivorans TaxID=2608793 RepID=A0A8B3S1S3_9EURY|nr:MAG: hypothetical protein AEth_00901 [Candidatus Argoarchaeum ethanivorans]